MNKQTNVREVSIQKDPRPIMHARHHLTPRTVATFLIMKVVAVDCNVVSALSVVMGMSCYCRETAVAIYLLR